MKKCFICDLSAETMEDIIPKWLLNKFDLWNLKMKLPNQTPIFYSKLKISCCNKCNNEVLSVLENKVSKNIATEYEIWMWAHKIHYGLTYKDKMLRWDRKTPKENIGDIIKRNDPYKLDKLFLKCLTNEFFTIPKPYGSVFKFSFSIPQPFFFAHLLATTSICISVGEYGYIVFINDGQTLKVESGIYSFYEKLSINPTLENMIFFYANCVEMMARHKLQSNFQFCDNYLIKNEEARVLEAKPVNKTRLTNLCREFGLNWIDLEL